MPTQNVFLAQWIALIFFHIAVFGASGSARAQSVDAVPDSGSAIAGVASTAIANLAANDSIDGAAAILGAAGNATVAQVGTWPTGIALDPSAGAVNVDATVAPGSYSFQYQLCDLNTPPDCAVTDIFLNASASILANPDSGTIAAGTSGTPVANVAANDIVNGAPATLGSSGNSTIAVVGTWPAGIGYTQGCEGRHRRNFTPGVVVGNRRIRRSYDHTGCEVADVRGTKESGTPAALGGQ